MWVPRGPTNCGAILWDRALNLWGLCHSGWPVSGLNCRTPRGRFAYYGKPPLPVSEVLERGFSLLRQEGREEEEERGEKEGRGEKEDRRVKPHPVPSAQGEKVKVREGGGQHLLVDSQHSAPRGQCVFREIPGSLPLLSVCSPGWRPSLSSLGPMGRGTSPQRGRTIRGVARDGTPVGSRGHLGDLCHLPGTESHPPKPGPFCGHPSTRAYGELMGEPHIGRGSKDCQGDEANGCRSAWRG